MAFLPQTLSPWSNTSYIRYARDVYAFLSHWWNENRHVTNFDILPFSRTKMFKWKEGKKNQNQENPSLFERVYAHILKRRKTNFCAQNHVKITFTTGKKTQFRERTRTVNVIHYKYGCCQKNWHSIARLANHFRPVHYRHHSATAATTTENREGKKPI